MIFYNIIGGQENDKKMDNRKFPTHWNILLLGNCTQLAIYNIIHLILTNCSVVLPMAETVGRLLGSITIFFLYVRIFDVKSFGIKKENFFRGILTGFFLFIIIALNIPIALESIAQFSATLPPLSLIVLFITEQIFVGIFEEFLFRGLILNTLLEKNNHLQYRGMIYSLLISSVLFGATHLLNLFDTPELVNSTIAQSVGATFMGVFLGAVYLRSRNIWTVVFFHALVDIETDLPILFIDSSVSSSSTSADIPFLSLILNILLNSVILFAGLFLARKSKTKYAQQ